MDMEFMTSSPVTDFNFDSACTSPYMSAATSPQRFGSFFYSAPTSPSRVSAYYHGAAALSGCSSLSAVPFNWEEKPGIPKSDFSTAPSSNYGDAEQDLEEIDFEFDFSGQSERSSLPADELFDGGKIKPLKPPPKFQYNQNNSLESPKSPKSPTKLIKEAFSPRHRKNNFDPFAAAIKQTQKQRTEENSNQNRGRERNINSSGSSNSRNKSSRSLSPFRVSDLLFDPEPTKNSPSSDSNNSSVWYKKWKIKDLLLFRSASEGRATNSDQMKKCNLLKKTYQEEVKNSSFRSTDSSGGSLSKRRSRAPVSAHELHYKINRAVSEEMKKKTSLPYRHGLLGCLGFHPTVPEMSNKGFGSAGSSMSRG